MLLELNVGRGADGVGVTWVSPLAVCVSKTHFLLEKMKESSLPGTSSMRLNFVYSRDLRTLDERPLKLKSITQNRARSAFRS